MTAEGFAADLGSMLGDGADLAPLMGTFSFSGRNLNHYSGSSSGGNSDEDKNEGDEEESRSTTRESASNFMPDDFFKS